jgi:hypothetical protein
LEAWLTGGLQISTPPLDFDCILNEPIWFNRHVYLPSDKDHGRLLKADLEIKLANKGFMHLKDLCSSSNSSDASSSWLSKEEAVVKIGSKRLGDALMSLIGIIPAGWMQVIKSKSREPFQIGEWCIRDIEAVPQKIPRFIYRIIDVLPGRLLYTRYRLLHAQAPLIYDDCSVNEKFRKLKIVEACVLQANSAKGQTGLLYCGNYRSIKLLLSRFSWQIGHKVSTFFEFSIRLVYRSLISRHQELIPAIEKWEKVVNIPLAASWPLRIAYINDDILGNHTKEKFYKILTRAVPVGRKFTTSSSISSACAFCNLFEDELHCFVLCRRLAPLWCWLSNMVSHACPWVLHLSDVEKLLGYTCHVHCNVFEAQIWRVFHAETIRAILNARCSKVFGREPPHIEAMKCMIKYRVQSTFSLYAASKKASPAQMQVWLDAFPCAAPQLSGRFKLYIP